MSQRSPIAQNCSFCACKPISYTANGNNYVVIQGKSLRHLEAEVQIAEGNQITVGAVRTNQGEPAPPVIRRSGGKVFNHTEWQEENVCITPHQ